MLHVAANVQSQSYTRCSRSVRGTGVAPGVRNAITRTSKKRNMHSARITTPLLAALLALAAGCTTKETAPLADTESAYSTGRPPSAPSSWLEFSQPYLQRSQNDRLIASVTVTNIGLFPQNIRLRGGLRVLYAAGAAPTAALGAVQSWTRGWVNGGATVAGDCITLPTGATVQYIVGGTPAGGGGDLWGHIESDGPLDELRASGTMSTVQDSIAGIAPMTNASFAIATGAQKAFVGGPIAFTQPALSRCTADRALAGLTVRNAGTAPKTVRVNAAYQVFGSFDGGCRQYLYQSHLVADQSFAFNPTMGARLVSPGTYVIAAGDSALFLANGGPAGAMGQVTGSVHAIDGSDDELAVGSLVSNVEDSSPNVFMTISALAVQTATASPLSPVDPGGFPSGPGGMGGTGSGAGSLGF